MISSEELLNRYVILNNSFKKNLVFHLGINAGFFSEFNNMVLAMLFCLKKKIRFELYSQDANFKSENGWRDFFLPFCPETQDKRHSSLNRRWVNTENQHLNSNVDRFKKEAHIDYLTADIWKKFNNYFFTLNMFTIPELKIHGRTQTAANQIIRMIWRYNDATEKNIKEKKNSIVLPEAYIGMHIRGGDKIIEHTLISGENYIMKAEKLSDIRQAFILTDDYRIFLHLQNKYHDWKFYTSCTPQEQGYFHEEYMKKNSSEKTDMLLNLFTAMDILAESNMFIGTFSSNPGMYLGMRMNKECVYGVDYKHWKIRW